MGKEKSKKKENKGLKITIVFFLIITLVFIVYVILCSKQNKANVESIFKKVEEVEAKITEYTVYGTHLNIKGTIEDEIQDIRETNLILAGADGNKEELELSYNETEKGLEFYTSELINRGVNLESITKNKYYIIIEVEYGKKDTKYYSLQNATKYNDVEYYTITKNNSNNKININFNKYETENRNINYMFMEVKVSRLPKDVYDVVIDPGHGGSDTGAEYKGYKEADLTLEYSKKVKKELEDIGLKVKITRDRNRRRRELWRIYCI